MHAIESSDWKFKELVLIINNFDSTSNCKPEPVEAADFKRHALKMQCDVCQVVGCF